MGVVESPLQCWEVLEQLSSEAVDCPGSVSGEVGATGAEHTESCRRFVTLTKCVQIAAHAGLVGDDGGDSLF